jgi:citrate lyase subunit beta / citryl-CoA lyase
VTARSYLYAPGDDPARIQAAFRQGADVVVLDLEDGVAPARRRQARRIVGDALSRRRAWVRINPARTADAEDDLEAVDAAVGLRLPKVRSAEDAVWLLDRVDVPVICSIESAAGLDAAAEIASVPGVLSLSLGSKDMTADLGCADTWEALRAARERLVDACPGHAPVDSVYYGDDPAGLRHAALAARELGFSGKSTLRPEQVATINSVFSGT